MFFRFGYLSKTIYTQTRKNKRRINKFKVKEKGERERVLLICTKDEYFTKVNYIINAYLGKKKKKKRITS